jgi:molecular chaperone GrpE
MVEAMLGVLDDIDAARTHDELVGPFAAVAEKLESTLSRFGWERYGLAGEPFDPTVHEALMHGHADDVTQPTVVQVLQAGHRVGERVVRAARVAVAEPGD